MALSNADRQALYQLRRVEQGYKRVSVYVSPEALSSVSRVIADTGMSQQDAINHLLQRDNEMFNPAQPVSETNRPPGVSPAELAALQTFQKEGLVSAQLARETLINGGEQVIDKKARVRASFLHNNIHEPVKAKP
ncbi:MAG: hypothetical protein JNK06_02345 [Candidatus Accumulibacter phosphatis]|uniref:hypothetical protein n=1 Tax=Candidatus Accumulibacter phosphatis TaxID=327160 RepID=UPI001A4CEA13|nr:hypothetical protein [Candidatus Accumulibacter phosphatis]